jgi:hypothetical protein
MNYIGFYDTAASSMMTTVHDPTVEEFVYFNRVKRPETSLKNAKPDVNTTEKSI